MWTAGARRAHSPWDNLNRLAAETYSDATVSRSYDIFGRLVQANDSAGGLFTFAYDLAGRLLGTTTPFGAVNYTYDGRGSMASRQVAGQSALSYTYDPVGHLTSASLPQASASFSYTPRNQLSAISRGNGVASTYSYDADARLLGIVHAKGSAILASDSYGYDAVGNRLSHTTNIGQSLVTPAATNTFNAGNQLSQFGSTANIFDFNGNLAQAGATTYAWDGRNRLKSIVTATGQATTFAYDFEGNLLSQVDSGTNLNFTKSFVLDNRTNVAYETGSDGTSFSVLAGRAVDSHLAVSQLNGQTLFGLTDGINSTVATVDQTGTKQAQFIYEPFGQTSTTGAYPFQFTGRVPTAANLYYYRTRFYTPLAGRFLSEDPIGFGGGDINLYQFASDSPALFGDPTGLKVNACAVGAAIVCLPIGILEPPVGIVCGLASIPVCNMMSGQPPWTGSPQDWAGVATSPLPPVPAVIAGEMCNFFLPDKWPGPPEPCQNGAPRTGRGCAGTR